MTENGLDSQVVSRFTEILQEVTKQTKLELDVVTLNIHVLTEFDAKILAVSRVGKSCDIRLLSTKFLPLVPLVRIDITFLDLENLYSEPITSYFVCKAKRVLTILNPEEKLRIYDQNIQFGDEVEDEVGDEKVEEDAKESESGVEDLDGQIGSLRVFDHIGNVQVNKEFEELALIEGARNESVDKGFEELALIESHDEDVYTVPVEISRKDLTLAEAISEFVDTA